MKKGRTKHPPKNPMTSTQDSPRGLGDLAGLGFGLLKGLAELGGVKTHLFTASREVLLAVQGLLGLVDRYVGSVPSDERQQVIRLFLTYARKTIRRITDQLPKGNEKQFRELHSKVMSSILEVLDMEIRKNRPRTSTPKGKMKEEVLQAIRTVLVKEIGEEDEKTTAD